jgi:hypothetical protein
LNRFNKEVEREQKTKYQLTQILIFSLSIHRNCITLLLFIVSAAVAVFVVSPSSSSNFK